jgi:hypothetical protein
MRMPRPLYHRGWGRFLGHTFLLITHQGRKSGKRRETVAMALTYDPDTRDVTRRTREVAANRGKPSDGLEPSTPLYEEGPCVK